MGWEERITIIPGVRGGKPCVRGTRITGYDILEYLAGGMTEAEILADFPSLTREDIGAALAFAAAPERPLPPPLPPRGRGLRNDSLSLGRESGGVSVTRRSITASTHPGGLPASASGWPPA